MKLDVSHLSKTYGTGNQAVTAIGDVTFGAPESTFVCIVGPSGCGKTTLLKCLIGLMTPTEGTVSFNDRRVEEPPEEFALVFQDYGRSLLPWLTVRGNVMLPLRKKFRDAAQREQLMKDALEAVGLTPFLDHYPWQLSGGMQQRVAIARAVAYQPLLMLMDEPFASVDAQTRADLEDLILEIFDEYGITVVLVTHDIDEAVYLADEVVVLSSSPSQVIRRIAIDLPRPRDQINTKELPEFGHLRAEIFSLIKRKSDASETAEQNETSEQEVGQ